MEALSPDWLSHVRFDDKGLVTVIAQDHLTGALCMVAWADSAALTETLRTGEAHFFSRSRQRLWRKGESSGNTLAIRALYLDCDGDVILAHVDPKGPSCHTGAVSCFYRTLRDDAWSAAENPTTELGRLEQSIDERANAPEDRKSYTKQLLTLGPARIAEKLREEAAELGEAVEHETHERVVSEAADLLYHVWVALRARRVSLREVLAVLRERTRQSGLAEKAARNPR
ncbi:MAG: bifunctional phosphoribosyl-AMP cyclohydrolase/phosphoribosyl-ATP diphosphatase HisIE [Deltaproteobacteria bacterium]|nr:bifunctional phosphoribosyl-AMP cyclohydrolase/phosphoribosyl-ATP diphosphatase HisIE [Deltaproteobacteria bacterium]